MADNTVILFKNRMDGESITVPLTYIDIGELTEDVDYKIWTAERGEGDNKCKVLGLSINSAVACAQAIGTSLRPDSPGQLLPQLSWVIEEKYDTVYSGNIYYAHPSAEFEGVYSNLQPEDWINRWRTKYYREQTFPNLTQSPASSGGLPYRATIYVPITNSDDQAGTDIPQIPAWVPRGDYDQTGRYSLDNAAEETLQCQFFLSNGNTFGAYRVVLPENLTGDYTKYRICSGVFGDHMSAYNMSGRKNKFAARIYGLSGERVDPWRYDMGSNYFYPGMATGKQSGITRPVLHNILEASASQTYLGMGYMVYDEEEYIGTLCVQFNEEDGTMAYITFNAWQDQPFWTKVLQPNSRPINWNVPQNTSRGGDGDYNYSSDNTGKNNGEDSPTNIALNAFGSMSAAGLTWALFTKTEFEKVLTKLRNRNKVGKLLEEGTVINPFEVIKAVHMIPTALRWEDYTTPRTHLNVAGWLDMDVNYNEILQRRWFYHFKTIQVKASDRSDSFLEWPPYTSAKIFLPFIGARELDVASFMDGQVEVEYCIDAFTGDCLARVYCTNNKGNIIEHDYSGNCAWRIPYQTGDSQQTMVASAISCGKDVVQGIASKNPQQVFNGAKAFATDLATTAIQGHTEWSTATGNSSVMGNLDIILEIYTPKFSMPQYYNRLRGYRSELGGFASGYFDPRGGFRTAQGFNVFKDVELSSISASEGEREEIK